MLVGWRIWAVKDGMLIVWQLSATLLHISIATVTGIKTSFTVFISFLSKNKNVQIITRATHIQVAEIYLGGGAGDNFSFFSILYNNIWLRPCQGGIFLIYVIEKFTIISFLMQKNNNKMKLKVLKEKIKYVCRDFSLLLFLFSDR